MDAAALAAPRKCFPGPLPGWDTGVLLQESCTCAATTGQRQRQLQAEMSFPVLLQTEAVFISHLDTVVVVPLQ